MYTIYHQSHVKLLTIEGSELIVLFSVLQKEEDAIVHVLLFTLECKQDAGVRLQLVLFEVYSSHSVWCSLCPFTS